MKSQWLLHFIFHDMFDCIICLMAVAFQLYNMSGIFLPTHHNSWKRIELHRFKDRIQTFPATFLLHLVSATCGLLGSGKPLLIVEKLNVTWWSGQMEWGWMWCCTPSSPSSFNPKVNFVEWVEHTLLYYMGQSCFELNKMEGAILRQGQTTTENNQVL